MGVLKVWGRDVKKRDGWKTQTGSTGHCEENGFHIPGDPKAPRTEGLREMSQKNDIESAFAPDVSIVAEGRVGEDQMRFCFRFSSLSVTCGSKLY